MEIKLLLKAKYKKRWKGADGKWRYSYYEPKGRTKKPDEVKAKRTKKGEDPKKPRGKAEEEPVGSLGDGKTKAMNTLTEGGKIGFDKFYKTLQIGEAWASRAQAKRWFNDQADFMRLAGITADEFVSNLRMGNYGYPNHVHLAIKGDIPVTDVALIKEAVFNVHHHIGENYNTNEIEEWLSYVRDGKPWEAFRVVDGKSEVTKLIPDENDRKDVFELAIQRDLTVQESYDQLGLEGRWDTEDDIFARIVTDAKAERSDQEPSLLKADDFYTPKALKGVMADDKIATLEKYRDSKITEFSRLGEGDKGVNETFKVKTEQGELFCLKPVVGEEIGLRDGIPAGTYATREASAYVIDQALGFDLVPPTLYRDSELGACSMQKWDKDATLVFHNPAMDVSPEKLMMGAVYDFIVFNTDRHAGNYMINEEKDQLVFIDNGLTLPDEEYSTNYNSDCFEKLLYDTHKQTVWDGYRAVDISDDIMKQIGAVDTKQLGTSLQDLGLSKEATQNAVNRIEWIKKNKQLPGRNDLNDKVWRKGA